MAFQSPVTYPVGTTAPIRLAGTHNPPFRIINNNQTGTVWISDNPGIQVGQGTPLHAGTSLQWEKKTELWCISDTDDISIIVTNEISDWQPDPTAVAAAIFAQGIPVVYKTEMVYNGIIGAAGPENISVLMPFPTNSIRVEVSRAIGIGYCDLIITSNKSAIPAKTVAIALAASFQEWNALIPTPEQPEMVSLWTSVNPGLPITIRVFANTAPASDLKQFFLRAVVGRLASIYFINIAAFGFYDLSVPPWCGELQIRGYLYKAGGGASPVPDIVTYEFDNTGASRVTYLHPFSYIPSHDRWAIKYKYTAYGGPMTLRIQNMDPGNNLQDVSLVVAPITGGLI